MSDGTKVVTGYYAPAGCQQITDLAAAVGFSSVPTNAKRVLLQAEAQNIRYRDDGTNPTAAIGMILIAGAAPTEYTGDFSAIKFIQAAATAKLNIQFFK